MHKLAVVFVSFFASSVVFCKDVDYILLRKEWNAHVSRVSNEGNYPCKDPQPRAVTPRELLKPEVWNEVQHFTITPHVTILHSCSSSGYCDESCSCGPSKIKKVSLIFAYSEDSRLNFLNVTAEDHIACKCREDSSLPK